MTIDSRTRSRGSSGVRGTPHPRTESDRRRQSMGVGRHRSCTIDTEAGLARCAPPATRRAGARVGCKSQKRTLPMCDDRSFKRTGGGGEGGIRRSPGASDGDRSFLTRARIHLSRPSPGPTRSRPTIQAARRSPRPGPPAKPAVRSTMLPSKGEAMVEPEGLPIARSGRGIRVRSATRAGTELVRDVTSWEQPASATVGAIMASTRSIKMAPAGRPAGRLKVKDLVMTRGSGENCFCILGNACNGTDQARECEEAWIIYTWRDYRAKSS